MLYLTSFKAYHETADPRPGYSIAVYQPAWYNQLPKIDLFDIRQDGRWIRPREFVWRDEHGEQKNSDADVLQRYHDRLVDMYLERYDVMNLHGLWQADRQDAALCCWCPYDKAARRQLETFGSFVCHSWPVETFLREVGFEVERDYDRMRMVGLE